jgi:hypothetical protein
MSTPPARQADPLADLLHSMRIGCIAPAAGERLQPGTDAAAHATDAARLRRSGVLLDCDRPAAGRQ